MTSRADPWPARTPWSPLEGLSEHEACPARLAIARHERRGQHAEGLAGENLPILWRVIVSPAPRT